LLGVSLLSGAGGCDKQSVIQANWAVASSGVVIAKGVSDPEKGGGWANDTIERGIGSVAGESGRRYTLDVDFTADGTALSAADPHLVVEISKAYYEDDAWISFYLFIICSVPATVGLIILIVSAVRAMRSRRKQPTLVS
jgi:hypothetical protein